MANSDPLTAKEEALALLADALRVQRQPCRHKGIGLPGCVICDPRVYPEARAALAAQPAPAPGLDVERLAIDAAARLEDEVSRLRTRLASCYDAYARLAPTEEPGSRQKSCDCGAMLGAIYHDPTCTNRGNRARLSKGSPDDPK